MPLTAAEWLKENNANWLTDAKTLEAYAAYVTSFVPGNVEKAIADYANGLFPNANAVDAPYCTTGDRYEEIKAAAMHGYSLAAGESVEFLGWIVDNSYMRCNPEGYWIKVGSENRFSASQLFDLFKKESNG